MQYDSPHHVTQGIYRLWAIQTTKSRQYPDRRPYSRGDTSTLLKKLSTVEGGHLDHVNKPSSHPLVQGPYEHSY